MSASNAQSRVTTVTGDMPGVVATEAPKDAPRRSFYRPELDALRLLAFLMVFYHHNVPHQADGFALKWNRGVAEALAMTGNAGGFGLPLFFFLSAFLIATLLLRELKEYARLDVKAFYIRRILRIWPLYYLAVAMALYYAVHDHSIAGIHQSGAFAVFLGDVFMVQHSEGNQNPMAPLWSISVEEQFYLLFPVVALIFGARRFVLLGSCVCAVSLLTLFQLGEAHSIIQSQIWYNGLSQAIFFGAGIIMAALYDRVGQLRLSGLARIGLLVCSFALFLAAVAWTDARHDGAATSGIRVAGGYALVALGCVSLISAFLDTPTRFPRFILFGGKISFGLYVFHEASVRTIEKFAPHGIGPHFFSVLSLPLTVLLAALSYKYYESWFLRLRSRFTRVKNRPV